MDDSRDFVLSGDHRLAIFKAHQLLNVEKLLIGDLGLIKFQFIIILNLFHDFCLRLRIHLIDRLQSLRKILFLKFPHPLGIEGPRLLFFIISPFLLDLL